MSKDRKYKLQHQKAHSFSFISYIYMLKHKHYWVIKKKKKNIDGFLGPDTTRAFCFVLTVVSDASGKYFWETYISR